MNKTVSHMEHVQQVFGYICCSTWNSRNEKGRILLQLETLVTLPEKAKQRQNIKISFTAYSACNIPPWSTTKELPETKINYLFHKEHLANPKNTCSLWNIKTIYVRKYIESTKKWARESKQNVMLSKKVWISFWIVPCGTCFPDMSTSAKRAVSSASIYQDV